ncbi:putative Zn-dependent protease [Actinoplanes lutulentus]|uniref:Tetratricopeptide repeat protein n=1 Tax=Actinoplanes lutulentus TaxID=1287878 RepID=A0A327Z2B4_9ACTN|nr:tetratricopeptide repeat protein [Actinoplanes lutulentus]MBB2948585.1 putative Zn-dependent protease [Actinoplanes lutulentus]RAK28044.1 tetratricopeptide repeat protein [Actinoplanes lutulentus]
MTQQPLLAPPAGHPILDQADTLLARGRAGDVVDLLAPHVGREPEHVGAWHRMAQARLELGDPQGAMRAAWAAWQQDPDGPESLFWISRSCSAAGDHTEAIETAASACRQDPGNPRLHNRLGEAQLADGRIGDAIANLQVAVELAGYDADLRVTYAHALFAAGRPLTAREELGRALTLDPRHAGAQAALSRFENLMRAVVDAPTLAQAADEFAESLRVRPATPKSQNRDAFAYAMRVSFVWFFTALLGVGAFDLMGLVTVPDGLYMTLLCASGIFAIVARLAKPKLS